MIKGVIESPLKIIPVEGGDVLHGMKSSDQGFQGFGEAYFSSLHFNAVKAWKRHREMTMNFLVPVGAVQIVVVDDRDLENVLVQNYRLSRERYSRLTIPPMLWVGLQGLSKTTSLLLNLASTEHDPAEVDRKGADAFFFNWRES